MEAKAKSDSQSINQLMAGGGETVWGGEGVRAALIESGGRSESSLEGKLTGSQRMNGSNSLDCDGGGWVDSFCCLTNVM